MARMPRPRAVEYVFEIVTWFPTEQLTRAPVVRVHLGRITRPSWTVLCREVNTADPLGAFHHFSRGRTAAGTDIHDGRFASAAEILERAHVRGREVVDVDVVTDGGAVGCGVVGAVDREHG